MLTRERIEEALEKSGKLSPKEARGIASDLLKRGRKETDDVLKDLENLLEKGRRDLEKRTCKRAQAGEGRPQAAPSTRRRPRSRRRTGHDAPRRWARTSRSLATRN